jgi:uncharacterized protein HemX
MAADSSDCWGAFDYTTTIVVIILSCVLGIVWAVYNFILVRKVQVDQTGGASRDNLVQHVSEEQRKLIIELGDKIADVRHT